MQTLADAVIVLWGWRRFAVAFVAGGLSALAFAPFFLFPILWLTIPVFVWLIDGAEPGPEAPWYRRLLPAAAVGFAFGFGYFLAGLWWIGAAFLVDADEFAWLIPIAVTVLPAGLALFWAFGAALARAFWSDGWARVVAFAVAMTAAEWLRGHLFTGFPWNTFGYALMPAPIAMQTAALIGLWGVTLAAFLIFAAPVLLVSASRAERRAGLIAFAAVALIAAAHLGFGAWRLAGAADPAEASGPAIRIMQPGIAQDRRWVIEAAEETMTRYLDVSQSAGGLDGVDVLVWPESAFPFILTERPSALAAIADLLPEGTSLITGAARAERTAGGEAPLVFNSVYVIDSGGEIAAAYDKVHLVPFGEYLPFRTLLEGMGLRQLIALPGGFSPGQRRRSIDVPGAGQAGPLVCYEIVFPGAAIDPDDRPAWLVNVTNDGWYGDTPGPHQHLHQAVVRAVEEGLPLIRAANTGISAIVDPYGRVSARLGLGEIGALDGNLSQALEPTPYARFGDTILLVLLGLAGGLAVGISLTKR